MNGSAASLQGAMGKKAVRGDQELGRGDRQGARETWGWCPRELEDREPE